MKPRAFVLPAILIATITIMTGSAILPLRTADALFTTPIPTQANTATPPPAIFAGKYTLLQTNPDKSMLKGNLEITENGAFHDLVWTFEDPKANTTGLGILVGERLVVATGGAACGAIGYRIAPDGKLDGLWVIDGQPRMKRPGTEQATPKTTLAKDGTGAYTLVGKDDNGGAYRGDMMIANFGDHYTFEQNSGGTKYPGAGVRVGDIFAFHATSTVNKCNLVVFSRTSPTALDGILVIRRQTNVSLQTAVAQ